MPGWDSIPEAQRPFQRRLMEIFAGFVEHVDVQAGKVVDELDRLGIRDNTIVIYIFGDNGASAEGQNGTISELLAQNGIPNTVEQQIAALDKIGGLEALGSPKTESMYHAGWAWAGNTPFQYTKLIASHFGGTRNPMVISWPKGIKPDRTPRPQFHHVNDIVPTIYEIVGIKPPKVVDGFAQDPIDGVSLAYTFNDPKAPSRKKVQYFDNNGSRAIYNDGWIAATFGPLVPWLPGAPGLAEWDSAKDKWELYHVSKDFSEADDLAGKEPKRLAELQTVFDAQAKANKVYPLGAGIWLRLHPEDRIKTPYTSWQFDATTTRMPEFTAPGIGRENNTVTIDAELGENASGVLYALGGAGGGVTLYMDKGDLVFEYNMMIIERFFVMPVLIGFVFYNLGGLPGDIARARNHPQAKAISICGWMGLITLIMWPVAMVWAYLNPAAGPSAGSSLSGASDQTLVGKLREASQRLATIEASLTPPTRGA